MHKVFENCYINIAATASVNSTLGLFKTREAGFLDPCLINIPNIDPRKHSEDEYLCFLPEYERWRNLVEKAPLASCGWVLQERWLSPRTLHFTASEVFWECTQHASETFPDGEFWGSGTGISKGLDQLTIGEAGVLGASYKGGPRMGWAQLIERYTACKLTYPSDRPVAILAFAQAVQLRESLSADYYVAGVWQNELTRWLLWHLAAVVSLPGTKPEKSPTLRGDRPKVKLSHLPTWSWISFDGAVKFPLRRDMPWEDCCYLRGIHRQDNEDPFGIEQHIKLTLCAPLLRIPPRSSFQVRLRSDKIDETGLFIVAFTDLSMTLKFDTDRKLPEELYIAPMLKGSDVRGLLLKPEAWSESTFVRVGYFEAYSRLVHLNSANLEIDSGFRMFQEIADESTWKTFHLV